MFRFNLFRIPVTVEPWFWVTTFLLGGGTYIKKRDDLIFTLSWMAVCFISILVHELGHAMSARKLAGGQQAIRLYAFGGLAYNQGGRWIKKDKILMILAGPGAGFVLFGVVVAAVLIAFPGEPGVDLIRTLLFFQPPTNTEALQFLLDKRYLANIISHFLYINLWWGLVNLLPVHPLDGGQITMELNRSQRKVHQIGLAVGAAVAVVALVFSQFYPAVMFGFLAWQNYENMKKLRY